MRVGIAESVPPPRLVIGFGKDRRTLDAVRVQDETVVYRYWLTVTEGDNLVHVAAGARPGGAGPNVVKPDEVAAQRQRRPALRERSRACTSTRWSSAARCRSIADSLPESHRSILFCTPEYGDASRLDCARQVIARFAERAFRRPLQPEEVDRLLRVFRSPMTGARASSVASSSR